MKKSATTFLQVVTVLFGIGVLALLLWEPQLEGRNAHATLFEIYFMDPFLAFVYAGSVPFFVALYQTFKILGLVGKNAIISQAAVKALRTIRYCGIALIGFVIAAEIMIMVSGPDELPPPIFMGLLICFGATLMATAAATFEKILQNALELKSENDLTV